MKKDIRKCIKCMQNKEFTQQHKPNRPNQKFFRKKCDSCNLKLFTLTNEKIKKSKIAKERHKKAKENGKIICKFDNRFNILNFDDFNQNIKISCQQCNQLKLLNNNNFKSVVKYLEKINKKKYFTKICLICQKENKQKYKIQWKLKNKDKMNQYNKTRNSNPAFRLRQNISRTIYSVLKSQGSSKLGKSIVKYLPYTFKDLIVHLQNLFDKNMSWDNYGSYWHLDHIIPQSNLPYTSMSDENFQKTWALNNLRPLEAKQNMSDGGSKIRHKNYEKMYNL